MRIQVTHWYLNYYTVEYKKNWWTIFWKNIGHWVSEDRLIGEGKCATFKDYFASYESAIEKAEELSEDGAIEKYEKDFNLDYLTAQNSAVEYNKHNEPKKTIQFK